MNKVDKYKAQHERLKRQLEQGGIQWWRPTVGKNMIRILPNWKDDNDVFYKRVLVHWNCGEKGRKLVCRKTLGEDEYCPVCAFVDELLASTRPEDVRYGEAMGQTERFAMNILDSKDWDSESESFEKGPQVFECGRGLFQNILWMFTDGEYGDLDDWEMGRYLLIERQGTGKTDTKYSILPASQPAPIDKDAIIEDINDLDALNKPYLPEQMIAVLEGKDPKDAISEKPKAKLQREVDDLLSDDDEVPGNISVASRKPVGIGKVKPKPAPEPEEEEEEEPEPEPVKKAKKKNGSPPSMDDFGKVPDEDESEEEETEVDSPKPTFNRNSEVTKRLERLKDKIKK